jgi:hypothetical protein
MHIWNQHVVEIYTADSIYKRLVTEIQVFLARRDNCPNNYCHDLGVGVGVAHQGKNFNQGYIFWTIKDRMLIFHI